MKTVRRFTSTFLTLIILLSCVAIPGISAGAVGATKVYNYQATNYYDLAYLSSYVALNNADNGQSCSFSYERDYINGASGSGAAFSVLDDSYDGNGFHVLSRTYQQDNSANAVYYFDRYSSTVSDMSELGSVVESSFITYGNRHQHSVGISDIYNKFISGSNTSVTVTGTKGNSYTYGLSGFSCGSSFSAGSGSSFAYVDGSDYKLETSNSAKITGAIPAVGESVTFRIGTRVSATERWNNLWNYFSWINVTLTAYDTTSLRNAIASAAIYTASESDYSTASFADFASALSNAESVLASSTVQEEIENATTALLDAISDLKLNPTVTFANYNGDILSSDVVEYGTTPVYSGATPVRPSDNVNHYTFSGWSSEISAATEDVTYMAEYTAIAHTFGTEPSNLGKCLDCGYVQSDLADYTSVYEALKKVPKTDEEAALFYDIDDASYAALKNAVDSVVWNYTSAENDKVEAAASKINDAYYSLKVKQYNITATGGATVTQVLNRAKSNNYWIATAKIKEANGVDSNGKWFVYWVDGNGEIVSTYSTYSFFAVGDAELTPVYVDPAIYETERAKAVVTTRVVGCRDNLDGSYSLLAERSVSAKAIPSINGYGILYTVNSAYKNSLTLDNVDIDDIYNRANAIGNIGRTGMSETKVDVNGADTIWAVPYVIDGNGNVTYGDVKQFELSMSTQSVDCFEIMTCGINELIVEQSEEVIPEQNTDEQSKSPLMRILSYIRMIIVFIISLFK